MLACASMTGSSQETVCTLTGVRRPDEVAGNSMYSDSDVRRHDVEVSLRMPDNAQRVQKALRHTGEASIQ